MAMSKDGAAKNADKLKGYVAKPEVKEIYATMKVSAKAIDVTNKTVDFLAKPVVMGALTKTAPAIAGALGKVVGLAKALGPAGVALGVGVDLMAAFGLFADATTKKLDEIIRLLEELKDDVKKGFEDMKVKLDSNVALQRFLPIYDEMLAKVQLFEQIVVRADGKVNADILYARLGDMVVDYPPSRIISDLKKMHNLITGEGAFGKALFKQLGEEVDRLEGEELDDRLPTYLLQFQAVVALEMRAVRMLRSFIAYKEEDVKYSYSMEEIFKDLALQRSKHDPTANYEWYLGFKAFGGKFVMTTTKWPNWYAYMQDNGKGNVRGWKGHPGDQGVFIITPRDGGKFLISTKKWPNWYMYMQDKGDGNVRGWKGDPGPQGHWDFAIKNVRERTFVLTTAKWPDWYMYMQDNGDGNIRGWKGDPGPQGHFTLCGQ